MRVSLRREAGIGSWWVDDANTLIPIHEFMWSSSKTRRIAYADGGVLVPLEPEPKSLIGPFVISSSLLSEPVDPPINLSGQFVKPDYAVPPEFHEAVVADIEARNEHKGRRRRRG